MSRTDDILAIIDGGLQHSTEHGYGQPVSEGQCFRCRAVCDGEMCDGCRAWMAGESDNDPADDMISDDPADVLTAFADTLNSCGTTITEFACRLGAIMRTILDYLAEHGLTIQDFDGHTVDEATGDVVLTDGRRVKPITTREEAPD